MIENLLDLDSMNCGKSSMSFSRTLNELYLEPRNYQNPKESAFSPLEVCKTATCQMIGKSGGEIMTTPLLATDHFDIEEQPTGVKKPVEDFERCFQDGYCKVVEPDSDGNLTGGAIDHGENDWSQENVGEEDELLGGMFDLSEEGKYMF